MTPKIAIIIEIARAIKSIILLTLGHEELIWILPSSKGSVND